jgi:tetratricopeptide (TPR) repeat protein
VYSLALVLVELLTDKPPLDGDDMPSLMSATLDEEIRPTPTVRGATVAPEVEAIFAKALALHAKDRYRHAGEFWNALLEASPKAVGVGTQQTLARIVIPAGDVLQPSDLAPEGLSSTKRSKTKSKPPSDAISVADTVATSDSASLSSVSGKTQPLMQMKADRAAIAPTKEKESSKLPMVVALAAIVVFGIVAWKWQSNGSPGPTSAVTASESNSAAPSVVIAETPKPKKKNKKWWEDIPDAAEKNAKDGAPKLAPARQKWLALREQSLSLGAEKKREEAVVALRTALDLACKQLGKDDPACVETMQMLAMLLAQMGKLAEAEELLREAVKINQEYGDPDDDDIDDSRQALVAVLLKQGKAEEAKAFWKPTDAPLPAPKTSASAASSAAPKESGAIAARTGAPAAAAEDTRDPWTQILDEISEEKASTKKAPAKPTDAKP